MISPPSWSQVNTKQVLFQQWWTVWKKAEGVGTGARFSKQTTTTCTISQQRRLDSNHRLRAALLGSLHNLHGSQPRQRYNPVWHSPLTRHLLSHERTLAKKNRVRTTDKKDVKYRKIKTRLMFSTRILVMDGEKHNICVATVVYTV